MRKHSRIRSVTVVLLSLIVTFTFTFMQPAAFADTGSGMPGDTGTAAEAETGQAAGTTEGSGTDKDSSSLGEAPADEMTDRSADDQQKADQDTQQREADEDAQSQDDGEEAVQNAVEGIVSFPVKYGDGSPVEDGTPFTLTNADDPDDWGTDYCVENGKLEVPMTAGTYYQLGLSWDYEKFDDYTLKEADENLGAIPLTLDNNGKTAVLYDRNSRTPVSSHKITSLVLQAKPADHGEKINVKDINVVMEDGTPAPDGLQIDVIDMSNLLGGYDTWDKYYVKNGKISGVQMKAEVQYKIGMDVKNPDWANYIVVGAYKSQHLMRIYSRYENEYPLLYDYDEGITGPEEFVSTVVLHKVKDQSELDLTRPTSCIMHLQISDQGYAAEGELPFRLTRKDTGKSKVVYSSEGELPLIADAGVPYELTLDDNPTYILKDPIQFTIKMDSKGYYQPVIPGYETDDQQGHLQCRYVELIRKDGKKLDGGKTLDPDDGDAENYNKFDPADYAKIYETQKVTLHNQPVLEKKEDGSEAPLGKEIKFVFYNATKAQMEQTVTSRDGVLPDVPLYKGNSYIVYAVDPEYQMPEQYIALAEDKGVPWETKGNGRDAKKFVLTRRAEPTEDLDSIGRVSYSLPVFYSKDGNNGTPAEDGVKITFTSPYETVTSEVKNGKVSFALKEDMNYVVDVDDPRYSMESFPMTMKDKSEWGAGKYAFNHTSCGSVNQLILWDKDQKGRTDDSLADHSKSTTIGGAHFGNGDYLVNVRVLPKDTVKGLGDRDYEVLDIDTINMYRTELSRWAKGNFKVSRKVPDGKKVAQVYYVDEKGNLVKIPFSEDVSANGGRVVSFEMPAMSMYNNVIEYKAEYQVVQGDHSTWTAGSDQPLTFRIRYGGEDTDKENGTYGRFQDLYLDGSAEPVDKSLYDTQEGSLIVNLKPQLLNQLAAGDHTMRVKFDNGEATASFKVASRAAAAGKGGGTSAAAGGKVVPATAAGPQGQHQNAVSVVRTGDTSHISLYAVVLVVAAAAAAGLFFARQRRLRRQN